MNSSHGDANRPTPAIFKTDEMKLVGFLEVSGQKLVKTETDYSDDRLRNGRTHFLFNQSPALDSLVAEYRASELAGKPLMVDVHKFFTSYMNARNLALRPRGVGGLNGR